MENRSVVVAIVISLGLIVSSAFISSGMKAAAQSIQIAGTSIGGALGTKVYSDTMKYEVKISDGGAPLRINTTGK